MGDAYYFDTTGGGFRLDTKMFRSLQGDPTQQGEVSKYQAPRRCQFKWIAHISIRPAEKQVQQADLEFRPGEVDRGPLPICTKQVL